MARPIVIEQGEITAGELKPKNNVYQSIIIGYCYFSVSYFQTFALGFLCVCCFVVFLVFKILNYLP